MPVFNTGDTAYFMFANQVLQVETVHYSSSDDKWLVKVIDPKQAEDFGSGFVQHWVYEAVLFDCPFRCALSALNPEAMASDKCAKVLELIR